MSIVFDRAAGYYDRTRANPPEIEPLVTQSIIDLCRLGPESLVLEAGIGTGRISVPLIARGYRVTGIDLSRKMMEELVKKAKAGGRRADLAEADATRMPFPKGVFHAVLAVHVLHLIPNWREGVAEVRRVLRPGGLFLASYHGRRQDSPNAALRKKLHALAAEYGIRTDRPGATSNEMLREELGHWGGRVEIIHVAEWEERLVLAELLEGLDQQLFSDTWYIPRPVMDQIMPRLTEFAKAEYGNLGQSLPEGESFDWIAARN